jgi:hypothetical protein
VNENDYTNARAAVIAREEPPVALLEECRRIVGLLVRTSGLPRHYSPYGVWSEEAIAEVTADWIATRLVERGQLLAMMQRSPVLSVFRRMAETSVRQHLIDSLKRSQASNLFRRVGTLLHEDDRFAETAAGSGVWCLAEGTREPFAGEDRDLAALGFSLGDFHVIRYETDARKLSPLLESGELGRFVAGLLKGGAMDAGTIVRALKLRFAIEEPAGEEELDADQGDRGAGPEAEVLREELATATLAELSGRQAEILVGIDAGISGEDLAASLGCSTGTISHERRQIEDILARLGADAEPVLKLVLDALFIEIK